MLAEDDIDGSNSSTAKKAVKRKGDLLEERILQGLRQELDQRGPSVSGTAVEEAVECDSLEPEEADEKVNAAEAKAAVAEAKAAEAEAKAAEAEAKAAEAEAKAAAADAKAVAAEEKAAECISRMRALQEHIQALEAQQFQERLDEAEARVEAAEAKALYAVDTLYPLLQDLPSIVDALKSSVAAGAAAACSAEPLRRPCKFGSVVIPATRMVRLENCQPSVYTQELAAMVFGTDVLAKSCLKGSSIGWGKEPLQKDAVDDIIAHVMSKFPVLSESTVRTFLRRKCNNAATALKKVAVNDEQHEQNRQQENTK